MISGVTRELNGETETFRLSIGAMMRIEDMFGKGIADVMSEMETGFSVSSLVKIISACAADGAGRGVEWAGDAIEQMGLEGAGELLADCATKAFPQAEKAKSGNGKRSGRQ